jgi:dipeptidyl-peptidase-4
VSPETLFAQPGIFGTPPRQLSWSPDGRLLAFSWAEPRQAVRSLWLVGSAAGGPRPLAATEGQGGLRELAWLPDGSAIVHLQGDDLLRTDPTTDVTRRLFSPGRTAHDLAVAPDGRLLTYLRDGDLWAFDPATERERRLTAVGLPALSEPPTGRYSRPEREIGPGIWGGPTYAWAPDSRTIAVHHVDRRHMRRVPFPNYLADDTDPNPVRRGYPGDPNEARRVGLLQVDSGELTLLPLDEPTSHQILSFAWSADGRLLIDTATDTNTRRRLYTVDAGDTAPLLQWESERDSRIYTRFAAAWHPDGDHVVLLADEGEHDGLYRLELRGAGSEPTRLTDPAWDVLDTPRFSSDGTLYFEGTGGRPAERQVFRLAAGEEEAMQLTQQPGHHQVFPAPAGDAVAILRSDDRTPTELYLATVDAAPRRITHSPTEAFDDFPLARVRYLEAPGHDNGPDLHVRLLLPADFDASRRYPVLFGPMYSNTVRNRWGYAYTLMQQALTQRGYLVAQVDMRGSTGYGRAFREAFLNDFAGGDIEDIEAAVTHLQSLPYVAGDRLGIWGSSYGGTLTVYTLLKKPGLFRAGVAAAAAVDPRFFGTDDVAIVRRPGDGSGIFARRAEALVDRLEDELLLVHGLQDQVVPFKTVASLTDAFIRAGKSVETAFLPGATHGWRSEPPYDRYVFERLVDFFDRHLKPAITNAAETP